MKAKTARRWLARNRWKMAKALTEWGIGRPRKLWKQYWTCLSITNVLFRRY